LESRWSAAWSEDGDGKEQYAYAYGGEFLDCQDEMGHDAVLKARHSKALAELPDFDQLHRVHLGALVDLLEVKPVD